MFIRTRALALFIGSLVMLSAFGPNEATAGALPPPAPVIITNAVNGANSAHASSWLAGGHAGYNWQQGGAVFGFETDLQGMRLNSSMNGGLVYTPPPPGPTDFARTQATIDWYGTFRGRLGTTFGPLLVYVTGGVAYGNVNLSSSFTGFGLNTQASVSQTKAGGVAGFGFEYLVQPNVMVTFGYQYVDLGRLGISSTTAGAFGCCTTAAVSQSASVHAQFQSAMVGVSWRFAPGATGPFSGAYVGAHGGGAWGNGANALYQGSSTTIIPPVIIQ